MAVVITVGSVPTQSGGTLPVLSDAEVESSKSPTHQACPVSLAGHSLQFPTGCVAGPSLIRSQMSEAVDEPRLVIAKPTRKVGRRNTLSFETSEDPRQEEEVTDPRLDGRSTRTEHRRECVANRSQTQGIEGPRLFERTQQRPNPLTRRRVEIEPANRRRGGVLSQLALVQPGGALIVFLLSWDHPLKGRDLGITPARDSPPVR